MANASPALPLQADAHAASPIPPSLDHGRIGQVVLVLQGGGALGAYQGGVFQAMHRARSLHQQPGAGRYDPVQRIRPPGRAKRGGQARCPPIMCRTCATRNA